MATKNELKAELDALGVDYPADAVKGELETILARAQRKAAQSSEGGPGGNAGARI